MPENESKVTTKKSGPKKTTTKKSTKPKTVKKTIEASEVLHNNEAIVNDNIRTAGDKACYCYVSINLTSNTRSASVISIGAVDSDGYTFYAETTDYNMKDVSSDVFETVVKNLTGKERTFGTIVDTLDNIRSEFITWLEEHYAKKNKFVQFVMDKIDWNWPIFKEFILGDQKLPEDYWISDVVVDLNNDLASFVTVNRSLIDSAIKGDNEYENFVPIYAVSRNVNRHDTAEEIGIKFNGNGLILISPDDNNALKKALYIRTIHQSLWGYSVE